MAQQRKYDDPFGDTSGLDWNGGNTGVSGYGPGGTTPPPVSGPNPPAPPQPGPGATTPPPAGGYDRTQFRDNWLDSTGSLQDFINQHPEFATGVTTGGAKNDIAYLPSGEIMDLQEKKGLLGNAAPHAWTGIGETNPGGGKTMYSQSGGGQPAGASSGGAFGPGFNNDSFKAALSGLFPNGMFNQDVVNRRTEGARQDLERFRKSQTANDNAALASRGLMGSGPEATAHDRMNNDIADKYTQAASGIYADESANADQRMMQALQIGAGMSASEASNAVNMLNAQNSFTLGSGRLALDNNTATNAYNLDLGRFGLDRDKYLNDSGNNDLSQLMDILKTLSGGVNTSAGGHK